jgi:hypothetical protein
MGGESKEQHLFSVTEVNQVIWNDISKTSNPMVSFEFKESNKK